MIDWQDEATLLSARPHGETSALVEVFTPGHGRQAGIVRGGASRRMAPHLQPGTILSVTWRARIEDHLGSFTIEPLRSRAGVLSDRLALAGLGAVAALLSRALPERDPHPGLYARTSRLLDLPGEGGLWPLAYLQWELALLEEMGFALDLATCAVTGGTEDLAYVSPRSGRAVSRAGAGDWAPRLLPLPPVLRGEGEADGPAIAAALAVTGHFVEHRLLGAAPPAARARLVALIAAG